MHRKISIKSLTFSVLAASLSFVLCANSIAADLINIAKNPVTVESKNDANVDSKGEVATDTLSETALVNLESIENETTVVTEPVSNTTSTQVNVSPAPPSTAAKNPYSQLVSLAFKGKGENGVRNYADAAEQFCREARDYNDANAQFALAWMYENGRGVDKNADIAALYFTKAAQQGHTSAKNWLSTNKGNAALAKPLKCIALPSVATTVKNAYTEAQSDSVAAAFYTKGPIYKLVSKIAPRFNIDTDLAMAFIAVESGFNPKATSNRNAQGLMQLIPETAARFNVKNAYDPEQNIKGGLAYLQWLLTYFEGDVELVAAAYNSGENTVDKFKGVPPYPETRKYVKKIAALYKKSYHPFREDSGVSKKSTINKVSG